MTGLPAKYARMGFAKGWRAYRGVKSSSHRTTNRGATLARRRSSGRRSFGGGITLKGVLVGAGVAALASKFGLNNPMLSGAGAYFIGGVPAVIGAIGPSLLGGFNGSTDTSNGWS